jgi:hypothetical protein
MMLAMAACLFAGCGSKHAVQPDLAVTTLRTALEGWRSGKTPEAMQQVVPAIVVQDLDWTGGAKLKEFQILDGGKPVDANLYAQVKLKLIDASGGESEKTVTYVVGTSPKLTVFRDLFR